MDRKQTQFLVCSRRASLTASLFYSLSSNLGNFGQKSHLTDSLTYLPIIQIFNSGYLVTHFQGAIFSSQSLSSLSLVRAGRKCSRAPFLALLASSHHCLPHKRRRHWRGWRSWRRGESREISNQQTARIG